MKEINKTAITLFTGGGLADIALQSAGFTVVAGLEIDAEIAEVANRNLGGHVRVGDVLEANPSDFPACDLLHVSPPCTNASVAKVNGKETTLDKRLAAAICRFIRAKMPKGFTLENVRGYRKFKSFELILKTLKQCGYHFNYWFLNSADYGVPQTRTRLILCASLDKKPMKPNPTHSKIASHGLFHSTERWLGWLESIKDLAPALPTSEFAKWQLERLPENILQGGALLSDYFSGKPNSDGLRRATYAQINTPAFAVVATMRPHKTRAFMIGGANTSAGQAAPGVGVSEEYEPTRTVNASNSTGWKAFIVEGSAAGVDNKFNMPVRIEDEPVFTMRGKQNNPRAWLSSGRVVSMTPRCLARFQSLPDWYELPDSNQLAVRIIGNGFPCLMAEAVFKQLA